MTIDTINTEMIIVFVKVKLTDGSLAEDGDGVQEE